MLSLSGTAFEIMLSLIVTAFAIMTAVSVHEASHAVMSNFLGDPTAKFSGRMTLNPLAHINPIGLLCFAVVGFGWANPVPINEYNFKHRKRDTILVSAAGGVGNILTAIVFALILKAAITVNGLSRDVLDALIRVSQTVIAYNIGFAAFNLFVPVPPLDGWNILSNLFNIEKYSFVSYIRHYSLIILVVLSMSGILSKILGPIQLILTNFVYTFIYGF